MLGEGVVLDSYQLGLEAGAMPRIEPRTLRVLWPGSHLPDPTIKTFECFTFGMCTWDTDGSFMVVEEKLDDSSALKCEGLHCMFSPILYISIDVADTSYCFLISIGPSFSIIRFLAGGPDTDCISQNHLPSDVII